MRGRRWCSIWALGLVLAACSMFAMGCASHQERGDRAYELGNYPEAMEHYEQVIEGGSRDPEVFYRAAQVAQRQGAFANAERYFSQSLRYGGGVEVAQSLAEFYVQTSNFSQAVQVLQYLLHITDDVQPVYADIGTALMYAGHYLDAERHLLLAQQMNPEEPAPYINLGVLYDNHIRNRPKAVSFYGCYLELTQGNQQHRMVETRLREIEAGGAVDTSRVPLECGQRYQMRPLEEDSFNLSEVFDLGMAREGQEYEEQVEPVIIEELRLNIPLDYEPTDGQEDRESGVEDQEVVHSLGLGEGESEDRPGMAEAEEAYEAGRYDQVLDLLDDGEDWSTLDTVEKTLAGEAAYRVGEFALAARLLEEVIEERPTPQRVEALLEIYRAMEDEEGQRRLCDRFRNWPDYRQTMSECEG